MCVCFHQLLKNLLEVPSYFSGYKKKDTLVEFQEFYQVEIHSILKPGLTRWLTLQPCAARILEQFNPLTLFFTDAVASKPNESNKKILKLLKDPFTKCYLEFLDLFWTNSTSSTRLFKATSLYCSS